MFLFLKPTVSLYINMITIPKNRHTILKKGNSGGGYRYNLLKFHIIGRWKNIILNQLDESYFYRSIDAIKHTSAEELKALAEKYLQPEEFYELVVV